MVRSCLGALVEMNAGLLTDLLYEKTMRLTYSTMNAKSNGFGGEPADV
jgi:hypothetical protein